MTIYFDWLINFVCYGPAHIYKKRYKKLLKKLFEQEFYFLIPLDDNRYEDGIELRAVYLEQHPDHEKELSYREPPCSILEMMIALAIRIESAIMTDDRKGDRTSFWFWTMIETLGLKKYDDIHYDEYEVQRILDTFLERSYSPEGRGGLFFIPGTRKDLTKVEIWYQMCWFLDLYLGDDDA